MYTKVFFDVGANDGASSVKFAHETPEAIVYAFEPVPSLVNYIKPQIADITNYKLIPKAVSDFNGKAKFNVAGYTEHGEKDRGGCSSLLDFSDKSQTEWPGRTDFLVTEIIEVDVIRLDNFIEENGITKIDYLHIDTQGSDLNVLMGLGKYISIVQEGIMEAGSRENILYFGQNTKEASVEFLTNNGFGITSVWSNDKWSNEVNIGFKRLDLL